MADAAVKRRELRRRKVLENCNDRLRKLAAADGRTIRDNGIKDIKDSELNYTQLESTKTEIQENTLNITNNVNEQTSNNTTAYEEIANATNSNKENQSPQSNVYKRNTNNSSEIRATSRLAVAEDFPKKIAKNENSANRNAIETKKRTLEQQKFNLGDLLVKQRVLFIIILGVLSRLILSIWQLNEIFRFPVFTLVFFEISVFILERFQNPSEKQTNSQLGSALLLFGIQNQSLVRLANMLPLIKTFAEDVGTYLFVFLFTHGLHELFITCDDN